MKHCDRCERRLEPGEVYFESTIARFIVGQPPPTYAAKLYECEACQDRTERTIQVADALAIAVLNGTNDDKILAEHYRATRIVTSEI
jgi:hypothetical protein